MEDTPKISVILRSQNDWRAWYDNIKTLAVSREVWSHINPDQTHVFEPQKPIEPAFHLVKAGVTSIQEFTPEDYEMWRRLLKDYDRRLAIYEKTKQNISQIRTFIRGSVPKQHHHYIYNKASVFDEVKALRDRFAPSERERKKELKRRYKDLQKPPRGSEIESWLSKWEETYSECYEANIPAVKDDDPV